MYRKGGLKTMDENCEISASVCKKCESLFYKLDFLYVSSKLVYLYQFILLYCLRAAHGIGIMAVCGVGVFCIQIVSLCYVPAAFVWSCRSHSKVMDYAIIQKQVSAPKFVIFLTLAAGINSFTYSCQNFIWANYIF